MPRLSHDDFRRQLAGLTDPDRRDLTGGEKEEIRLACHRLGCILAHLYHVSEDRKDLWEHVGKALAVAGARVSDADLDRFVSLCLESVQAEPGEAARCDALLALLQTFGVRPPEWRMAFLQYLKAHHFPVVVHARARWESYKKGEVEL